MNILYSLAFALFGLGPAEAGMPEIAVITYTIAPGESGSPIETVTVARRGLNRTITLTRKVFKTAQQTETLPLKADEFDAVWAIVNRDKLLEFTPDQPPGTAFDYGLRALKIETRETLSDKPLVRDSRWTAPIENQKRLDALLAKLSRLAQAHGKKVILEQFVP